MSLRVDFSRFSFTYVSYTNRKDFGRNQSILGKLGENPKRKVLECSGQGLGRRATNAPGGRALQKRCSVV